MGMIATLRSWFGTKSDPVPIDTAAALAAALGGGYQTVTGQSVSTVRAMQMTTVFGCVRVLAESVGMLPCRLMREAGRNREVASSHRLHRLLSVAPNGYMTAQEFWELLMVCLCLRGNFFAYKVWALGNVVELLPIDPGCVRPKLGDDWTVSYEVTFRDGTRRTLGQDEIWHVRLFTLDGLNGLNPIAYARQAIALGLATEEHGSRLFTNGAVSSGVLQTDKALTDEAFARLKTQLTGEHMGVANAYKPMILEMGLDWKPISLNAEDSQFLATRQMQRNEICAIYRVPPQKVASLENATLNNAEHFDLAFHRDAVVPYLSKIESRIRIGLLNEKDQVTHYAKFNAAALLRGDLKTRYESYGKGIQWGILSPNDCRELEDLNPRDGGDIYLTPMNMTTNPEAANGNQATP